MMIEFILPDIGEGIVECELLEWLVKEGDTIVEDQAVAEVMTDKATVQIPAMYNGRVTKLHYKEGDIAKVHAPLFAMDIDGADITNSDTNNSDTKKANVDLENVEKSASQKNQVEEALNETLKTEHSNVVEAFILPDIGEGIVECEIVKWCIQEGDVVEEDQVVVEVMTDKAVVEIPAKYHGRVSKLHYQQGDIAIVHTPLFDQIIGSSKLSSNLVEAVDIQEVEVSTTILKMSPSTKLVEDDSVTKNNSKALASPAVRRIAREYKVNLAEIKGSGKKGRVLKQDVDAYIQAPSAASSGATNAAVKADHLVSNSSILKTPISNASASSSAVQEEVIKIVPMRGIKAAMAKQMLASAATIPHFTVSDELMMDNLIALRSSLKPEFEKQGVKLSFMPFFIKSLSLTLKSYPEMNSRLTKDESEWHYLKSHNIGMAVDSKIGLLVPNIKNVQNLSLFEVAVECDRIINAAREGKLSGADLANGTISISNIGALGGITATPVINKPEVAIVALGKTQKLPRFDDAGNVFAQSIMMLNWSGDHRVIDGATMVRFNNLWMSYLQSPEKMLVHLK
ncbi:MAG: 2-oxoisovalerate dehydrogenase E2 component (dihydrolipoyl transacylase) [Glaciecola sp.]|jgi:2-oxoisovalerate dehydrogenase E2 component (dihydrolipoyl transacylase)